MTVAELSDAAFTVAIEELTGCKEESLAGAKAFTALTLLHNSFAEVSPNTQARILLGLITKAKTFKDLTSLEAKTCFIAIHMLVASPQICSFPSEDLRQIGDDVVDLVVKHNLPDLKEVLLEQHSKLLEEERVLSAAKRSNSEALLDSSKCNSPNNSFGAFAQGL